MSQNGFDSFESLIALCGYRISEAKVVFDVSRGAHRL